MRCYEQFLTKNQDSEWADEALFCAACLRSQPLGEYPRALELMRLVVDRYPRSNTAPRALFHLAWDHESENRLQEALRLYERLMQDFPDHRLAFRARENRTYLLERINGKKP